MLKGLLQRMLGRDGRTEADVRPDPANSNSRAVDGSRTGRDSDGSTTGTSPNGDYVGLVAGDADFTGETGAERRAEHEAG